MPSKVEKARSRAFSKSSIICLVIRFRCSIHAVKRQSCRRQPPRLWSGRCDGTGAIARAAAEFGGTPATSRVTDRLGLAGRPYSTRADGELKAECAADQILHHATAQRVARQVRRRPAPEVADNERQRTGADVERLATVEPARRQCRQGKRHEQGVLVRTGGSRCRRSVMVARASDPRELGRQQHWAGVRITAASCTDLKQLSPARGVLCH